MKKISAFILLLVFTFSTLPAQELKRIGGIGASFQQMNDSIAKANGLNETKGLLVSKVHGQTAGALKVVEGDVLLSINGQQVGPAFSSKIYNDKAYTRLEGDYTAWMVWRNKKEVTLKAKMLPKPRETSEEFEIVYDHFDF